MLLKIALLVVTANVGVADPDEDRRAGHPQELSIFARPSDNGGFLGYYLGGGCLSRRKAEPPTPDEGTWGWDFTGRWFTRRVDLGWWHGRRYQGGSGAYKTDGPKLPE
jgi:hypothetical protein